MSQRPSRTDTEVVRGTSPKAAEPTKLRRKQSMTPAELIQEQLSSYKEASKVAAKRGVDAVAAATDTASVPAGKSLPEFDGYGNATHYQLLRRAETILGNGAEFFTVSKSLGEIFFTVFNAELLNCIVLHSYHWYLVLDFRLDGY